MDFLDGITFQRFELEGWGLLMCLPISFCFGSEILKKIGPPQPLKKTPKKNKKDMDFHDGITLSIGPPELQYVPLQRPHFPELL